jgi:putative ABC transport system substrate-binding protein
MRDRRAFIFAMAGGLFLSAAYGQQTTKVYRVGFLSLRAGPGPLDEVIVQALRDLGYVVGRNLVVEYRWADNDSDRLRPFAEELVRLRVDVIVASATPAIRAAMRATDTIPIVMATSPDPVGTGVVTNLSHPGGNVTGVSIQSSDLAPKRVQIMREIVPGLRRIAVLGQKGPRAAPDPARNASQLMVTEARRAGLQMGVDVTAHIVVDADDLSRAFAAMKQEGSQAMLVQVGPLTYEHRAAIVAMAARDRVPAIYDTRDFVDVGGLMSYGAHLTELYRRAATYVDRILKGAKPGDLAVEQPAKFELVINLKTAKALGLTIPQSLLLRADEVIE